MNFEQVLATVAERDALRGRLNDAEEALLNVCRALGYDLTDEEIAEQRERRWAGVAARADQDFFALRDDLEEAREDARRAERYRLAWMSACRRARVFRAVFRLTVRRLERERDEARAEVVRLGKELEARDARS